MAVRARVKITTPISEIEGWILFEFRKQVDARLRRASPVIARQVGRLLENKIRSTPHIASLLHGQLRQDFGLSESDAAQYTEEIISAVKSHTSTTLKFKTDKKGNRAVSIVVKVAPDGFISAIAPIGAYQSYGGQVSWLSWLLTKGTEVAVDGFRVFNGDDLTGSRAGDALMIKGGVFRVDPEFAGTENDNFILEAVRGSLVEISEIIRTYI